MNSSANDRGYRDYSLSAHAVRLRELCDMVGLSRSTVYALLRDDPTFPRGFYPSVRARAWLASDVIAWRETRIAQALKQDT